MTRRGRPPGSGTQPHPMGAVDHASQEFLAGEITRVLDAVKDYSLDTIKGQLWQKPTNGLGPFGWIEEVYASAGDAPFDLPGIFADLKERFGGGNFELRVFAGGRQRAVVQLPIAKEKTAPAAAAPAAPAAVMGMGEIFTMMMAQQADARRDQQAAADRQATMLTGLLTAAAPAIGALFARPAGPSIADQIALATALQGGGGKGGPSLKELVETVTLLKGLTEPGDASGGDGIRVDPDDLVATGARMIGPAMRALTDYMAARREGGAHSASGAASGLPEAVPQALGAPPSRFRVIDLVRADVAYFFERGHDPAKAADLVYDVIVANNVTAGEISEVATAFALSPSGLDDLAREGLDLRSRPGWAAEFFSELVAIHTEQEDDSAGGDGGQADASADGAADQGGAT